MSKIINLNEYRTCKQLVKSVYWQLRKEEMRRKTMDLFEAYYSTHPDKGLYITQLARMSNDYNEE